MTSQAGLSSIEARVRDERKRRRDKVQLRDTHQILPGHINLLPTREVRGIVKQREEPAARGPGELVPEGVPGALGRGEATTVRMELLNLGYGERDEHM